MMVNNIGPMKPIWWGKQGQRICLYDMGTTHIKRALEKISPHMRQSPWTILFTDELAAREGEDPTNKDNLTIVEIRANRKMRRVLLGLPPEVDVDPIMYDYGKPKTSLFEDYT